MLVTYQGTFISTSRSQMTNYQASSYSFGGTTEIMKEIIGRSLGL
jgi:hypothetical protein